MFCYNHIEECFKIVKICFEVTSNVGKPMQEMKRKPFYDRMVWTPRQIAWYKAHGVDTSL